MNTFLLHPNSWLLTIGGLLIIRQLFIILAAEQGRKQDLVKKLYKANTDFNITVLIPYLNIRQHTHLTNLLKALAEQHYPASKVLIHIIASEDTATDLDGQSFNANVKLWTYPESRPSMGEATAWMIERCLAAGNAGLITFLKPTDIVKPDFFQNIAARELESPVVQGYIAQKQRTAHPLDQVIALENRLANRIGNAGRYHLGLSCLLMSSGWVIKQDVLEMIPFPQSAELHNLTYAIRLNLQHYKVTWAPNVVVYTDEHTDFFQYITQHAGNIFNRLQLLMQYGFPLLIATFLRFDFTGLEYLLTLLSPPGIVVGAFLFFMAFLGYHGIPVYAAPGSWMGLGVSVVLLHLLSLVVARCKPSDYMVSFFWIPIVYLAGMISLPFALANHMAGTIFRLRGAKRVQQYKQMRSTRFNETLPASGQASLNLFDDDRTNPMHHYLRQQGRTVEMMQNEDAFKTQKNERVVQKENSYMQNPSKSAETREQVKAVILLFQGKQVECLLKTRTTFTPEGEELYQMTLEYKTHSFSTAVYKILDQAFYELLAKLQSRGLIIYTCGSCGNFYNPTADVPDIVKNTGVCLYDKLGQEVDLSTDAVTVVTQACSSHCDVEQREMILRAWRESLVEGVKAGF